MTSTLDAGSAADELGSRGARRATGPGQAWLSQITASGSYEVNVLGDVMLTASGLGVAFPIVSVALGRDRELPEQDVVKRGPQDHDRDQGRRHSRGQEITMGRNRPAECELHLGR